MSKLDDLIKKYCPDGVEYKTLGKIAEIVRGGQETVCKRDSYCLYLKYNISWIFVQGLKIETVKFFL